jgi:hypothetical protein
MRKSHINSLMDNDEGFIKVIGVSAKKQQRAQTNKIAAYNSLPVSERLKIDEKEAREKARLARVYKKWAEEAEEEREMELRRREITGRYDDPIVEQTLKEFDDYDDIMHIKHVNNSLITLLKKSESFQFSQTENHPSKKMANPFFVTIDSHNAISILHLLNYKEIHITSYKDGDHIIYGDGKIIHKCNNLVDAKEAFDNIIETINAYVNNIGHETIVSMIAQHRGSIPEKLIKIKASKEQNAPKDQTVVNSPIPGIPKDQTVVNAPIPGIPKDQTVVNAPIPGMPKFTALDKPGLPIPLIPILPPRPGEPFLPDYPKNPAILTALDAAGR